MTAGRVGRVEELLQAKRPSEALELVDAALREQPDDVALRHARLLCLSDIGQFELAIEYGKGILELDPGHAATKDLLAALESALAAPERREVPSGLRPYGTAIPESLLLSIQQAIHHYRYRGRQLVKSPFDLALYSMLLWDLRPGTIIEIGSKAGGGALWLGDTLRTFDIDCHVHSFDVVPVTDVTAPNVTFHRGNGQNLEAVIGDEMAASFERPLLVIEDADHTFETTIAVLRFFHRHTAPGDYVVVEDGNLSDVYPALYPNHSSGPHRAIRAFLDDHSEDYVIDAAYCDFFGYNATTCSNGFLRRLR